MTTNAVFLQRLREFYYYLEVSKLKIYYYYYYYFTGFRRPIQLYTKPKINTN